MDEDMLMEKRDKRFNRYMVECEFETWLHNSTGIRSFNRYMVECE